MHTSHFFWAAIFFSTYFVNMDAKNSWSSFPEEYCYLGELQSRAEYLKKDQYKRAASIIEEINDRVDNDPHMRSLTDRKTRLLKKNKARYHHPFDNNRLGRHIKGFFVNASNVKMKRQNFILASCPRTRDEVRDYLDGALSKKVHVFVSCLTSREAKTRKNNFWHEDEIKKIILRDGTKISHTYSQILQEKENTSRKLVPKIIQSELYTSNGTKIIHLHYEGWRDKAPMPSLKLFRTLINRILELSPDPTIPIAINCKGGVGRTGTLAVSLYLRRLIDAKLAKGKKLDTITVNIPEVIYEFRNHRKSMVGVPKQLTQIYSSLAAYYEELNANEMN